MDLQAYTTTALSYCLQERAALKAINFLFRLWKFQTNVRQIYFLQTDLEHVAAIIIVPKLKLAIATSVYVNLQ